VVFDILLFLYMVHNAVDFLRSRDSNQEKILILFRISKYHTHRPNSSSFVRNNERYKVIRDMVYCLQNNSKWLKNAPVQLSYHLAL
jgi:hypothetical protein